MLEIILNGTKPSCTMMGFYISNIFKARLMLNVDVVLEEINPKNGSQQKLKTMGV